MLLKNISGVIFIYNMFNMHFALTKGQRLSFKKFLCNGNDTIVIDDKFLDRDLKKLHLY